MNKEAINSNETHKHEKNVKTIGYVFGVLAVIFYAIINILSQTFYSFHGWSVLADENYILNTIIYAAIFVTIKEFTTIIAYFLFGINPISRFRNVINAMKIATDRKNVYLAMIAGVFGGAIGFSLTTAGGIFISSGFASPFYATEIIFVLAVVKFFFKRKTNIYQNISIVLIFIAIVMIPVLNDVVSGVGTNKNTVVGLILVILGVVCWAVESIIFDYVSERKNVHIRDLIFYKQVASFLFMIVFLLPIIPLFGHSHGYGAETSFKAIGYMFSDGWKQLLVAISAGILLYVGRFFFFRSTEIAGATTSNVIYNSLLIVQLPLSYIASVIDPRSSVDYVGTIHHEFFWPLILVLLIGIGLNLYGQMKHKMKL